MKNKINTTDVVVRENYNVQLQDFERGLLNVLAQHNLPTESIFVNINERMVVFQTIGNVLMKISSSKKEQSIYLSKFAAAVASGLFDAALNYLWDETIFELRERVAQYDIAYFYSNAISNVEKRNKLKGVDDLVKIEDSELIHGARQIGLLSELGYKHLDYIRYMRNWASAAHPNQNEITGLQLISWLETCIKEVIALPLSIGAVEIKQLLTNIRTVNISDIEAKEIAASSMNLTQEQINNLVAGLFGIYTQTDTLSLARQNIHLLLPLLWGRVDEVTRTKLGMNYGKYAAINDQERKKLTQQFLNIVSATSYIADDFRIPEIENAIDNLLLAHRGPNNFYNEPAFARALQNVVGQEGKMPTVVNRKYVLGIVEVFLTNGHGDAFHASPTYRSLIDLFDANQAVYAILSFYDDTISSKLQFARCKDKYYILLNLMKSKVSAPAIKELIEDIEKFKGSLDKLKDDKQFDQKRINMLKIVG